MDGVVMGKKELSTYRHAMNVSEGRINITEFSIMIGKSYRQAQRIIKKIKEKGPLGAVHGNQGRAPVNKTPPEHIKEVTDLLKSDYHDFNLIHFQSTRARKVASGNVFSFKNTKYLIKENKDYRFRTVNINSHQDGSTSHDIMGKKISVEEINKQRDNLDIAC